MPIFREFRLGAQRHRDHRVWTAPGRHQAALWYFLLFVVSLTTFLASTTSAGAQPDGPEVCGKRAPGALGDRLIQDGGDKEKKHVELRSPTKFLPGHREGEFVLRHPLSKTVTEDSKAKLIAVTDVRLFAGNTEISVYSFGAAPSKDAPAPIEGFLPSDSLVIYFGVPAAATFIGWQKQDFIAIACSGGDMLAWGSISVPISNHRFVATISIATMIVLYVLFVWAVWWARNRVNPLHAKYPAYDDIRRFSFLEYLFNPVHLTTNAFNRASVQKFQILLFSFLVAGMLLSYVLTTGNLSDLSKTIVFLLGISGIGAAVGQGANQQRDRLGYANWTWLVRRRVLPIHQADIQGPRWGDLVLTNREFDMYKFQNLLFSVVVALALLVAGEGRLTNFTIPETLLGILGLSQVVYLAGILVRPPAIAELDDSLTKLRDLEATLKTAMVRHTDVDDKGKLIEPQGVAIPVAVNAWKNYNDQADLVESMIEAALEVEVDRAKLMPFAYSTEAGPPGFC